MTNHEADSLILLLNTGAVFNLCSVSSFSSLIFKMLPVVSRVQSVLGLYPKCEGFGEETIKSQKVFIYKYRNNMSQS